MRIVLAFAICLTLSGQATKAQAHACNNRHYVNSSGHDVDSPSCGVGHLHREAICRDGSVSFSEHRRGTARTIMALSIGSDAPELIIFRILV